MCKIPVKLASDCWTFFTQIVLSLGFKSLPGQVKFVCLFFKYAVQNWILEVRLKLKHTRYFTYLIWFLHNRILKNSLRLNNRFLRERGMGPPRNGMPGFSLQFPKAIAKFIGKMQKKSGIMKSGSVLKSILYTSLIPDFRVLQQQKKKKLL